MSDKNVCECDPQVTNYVDNCIMENSSGLLYRNGDIWIGSNDNENDSTDSILVHSFCPFDYCNSNSVGVDLKNPDSQCALSHSGILCGDCLPGLSLAIGSSIDVRIVLIKMIIVLCYGCIYRSWCCPCAFHKGV